MGSRNEPQSDVTGNTYPRQNDQSYLSPYIQNSNTGAHAGSADASTILSRAQQQTHLSGNGMTSPNSTFPSSSGAAVPLIHGLPYDDSPSRPLPASPISQQYPSVPWRDTLQDASTTGEYAPVLQFDSWDAVSKVYDAKRRQKLVIPDDDVDDVELNKFSHVKSLIVALKTTTFKDPPITRTGLGEDRKMGVHAIDEDFRRRLITAFERANNSCSVILSENNSDLEVEYHAWNIFNEIINAHRIGSWNHSQIKASFIKCSERMQLAIKRITDSSNIRHKMLEADDVRGFCLNPDGYAYVIWRNLDNNIKRQYRTERANGAVAEPVDQKVNKNLVGRGAAVEGGAASRRRRPATDVAKEERVPKKRKTKAFQDATSGRRQSSSASIQNAPQIDPALSTSPAGCSSQYVNVSKGDTARDELAPLSPPAMAAQTVAVSVFPLSNASDRANHFHGPSASSANRNLPWLAPNTGKAPITGANSNDFSNWVPENRESQAHDFDGLERPSLEGPFGLGSGRYSANANPMPGSMYTQSTSKDFPSHNQYDPNYLPAQSSSNHNAAADHHPSMGPPYPGPQDMARSGLSQGATPTATLDNLSTERYVASQAPTGKQRQHRRDKPT